MPPCGVSPSHARGTGTARPDSELFANRIAFRTSAHTNEEEEAR